MYLLAYCNHKFSAGNFTFNVFHFSHFSFCLPSCVCGAVRVCLCVYDVSGSPELSQCQLTKDLLKACFKMALKRVGFGCVCVHVCVYAGEHSCLCICYREIEPVYARVLLLLHFPVSCSPRRVRPSLGPAWHAGKALLQHMCV